MLAATMYKNRNKIDSINWSKGCRGLASSPTLKDNNYGNKNEFHPKNTKHKFPGCAESCEDNLPNSQFYRSKTGRRWWYKTLQRKKNVCHSVLNLLQASVISLNNYIVFSLEQTPPPGLRWANTLRLVHFIKKEQHFIICFNIHTFFSI